MRLTEYEYKIKDLINQDRNNPDIYTNLQLMTYNFLRRKKVCDCQKDAEDISFDIAGDWYLRIVDGEDFSYLLGFLERSYRSYIVKYYGDRKETITFDESIDAKQVVWGNPSTYEYNVMSNKIYLEEIGRVVDRIMTTSCKYRPDTPAYINLKLSLILSLLRGTTVSFHLNQEQEFYLKIMEVNFYSKVKEDGLDFLDTPRLLKG